MKKSLITTSLMLLMLVTSCGGKSSDTAPTNVDPVKPSTTYTDPDEADKDSGNTDNNEPVKVESSPYTQEELYFGARVFGKDFLEANASEATKPNANSARVVEFQFDSQAGVATKYTPIVAKSYDGMFRPFSLVTEEETFLGAPTSAAKVYRIGAPEVGGLYAGPDTLANNGNYAICDGYGNRILNTNSSGYFYFGAAVFEKGYMVHEEENECAPIEGLHLQFNAGSSSSSYKTYEKFVFYKDTKVIAVLDYNAALFCPLAGQHQGDDIEGIEFPRMSLDKYGKKDWTYTEIDGHFRFYNEQGKIVSAIATNFKDAVPEYSTTWFSANHLNIQTTYETDDKHNYTFTTGGKYYNVTNTVFEYTTGKTYQVKNLNYVVSTTTDMKYSNTYYDFTLANVQFISNKTLQEFSYTFIIDKDLVLRDDVTELISAEIVKTDNYYYSTANGKTNFFDKSTAVHALSVNKANIVNMYPCSEMFAYKTASSKLGLVGFDGKYLFDADYANFCDPQYADGYNYIVGKKYTGNEYYLLNLKEKTKTYLGKPDGANTQGIWSGYYLVENSAEYRFYNLTTGETVYTYNKSYVTAQSDFVNELSGAGRYSMKLFHFEKASGGFIILKFGEKLVCDNNQKA
ncbi:MAG: hypothetical protein MJ248_04695 [Bacilli bacterium]|nr:hypothetical protein [Bacilli bacterium]